MKEPYETAVELIGGPFDGKTVNVAIGAKAYVVDVDFQKYFYFPVNGKEISAQSGFLVHKSNPVE